MKFRTSLSGQRGVTGTRFIFWSEITTTKIEYMRLRITVSKRLDVSTRKKANLSDPWETRNKLGEPYNCPGLLLCLSLQVMVQQGGGTQLEPSGISELSKWGWEFRRNEAAGVSRTVLQRGWHFTERKNLRDRQRVFPQVFRWGLISLKETAWKEQGPKLLELTWGYK